MLQAEAWKALKWLSLLSHALSSEAAERADD